MIHLSKYLYLAAIIVIVVFSACSGNSNDEPENEVTKLVLWYCVLRPL